MKPRAAQPSEARAPIADRVFLGLLVTAFPLAMTAHFLHWSDAVGFALCCLAIVPLARLIGEATEVLAHVLGSALGSLLNVSFGNAAELVLGLAALRAGRIHMVKASLTGSILANLLLIVGLSMFLGGLGRDRQTFNTTSALAGVSMLFLALVGLALPDLFHAAQGPSADAHLVPLSAGVAAVLLTLYALSLWFSIKTHKHLYTDESEVAEAGPRWSPGRAAAVLAAATAGTIVMAEILVESIEGASAKLGLSETFAGVIVLALVGNAAENTTAIVMARKGRMNLAFNIAVESSKQIALFVAPALVLFSLLAGPVPMTLEFSHLEVAGMAIGVAAVTLAALDGESNWLEGAMLIALYAILAVMFYHTTP